MTVMTFAGGTMNLESDEKGFHWVREGKERSQDLSSKQAAMEALKTRGKNGLHWTFIKKEN